MNNALKKYLYVRRLLFCNSILNYWNSQENWYADGDIFRLKICNIKLVLLNYSDWLLQIFIDNILLFRAISFKYFIHKIIIGE